MNIPKKTTLFMSLFLKYSPKMGRHVSITLTNMLFSENARADRVRSFSSSLAEMFQFFLTSETLVHFDLVGKIAEQIIDPAIDLVEEFEVSGHEFTFSSLGDLNDNTWLSSLNTGEANIHDAIYKADGVFSAVDIGGRELKTIHLDDFTPDQVAGNLHPICAISPLLHVVEKDLLRDDKDVVVGFMNLVPITVTVDWAAARAVQRILDQDARGIRTPLIKVYNENNSRKRKVATGIDPFKGHPEYSD